MHAMLKKVAGAVPAAALLLALAPASAQAVTTAAPDPTVGAGVTCHGGAARISIKPGLTFGDKAQTWTGAGTTSGCNSSDSKLSVSSANASFTGTGKGSCLPALGIPNAEMTGAIRWTMAGVDLDNQVSKVRGTAKLALSGATFEGVVTDGPFKGNKVNATANWDFETNIVQAVAGCFTGGYTDATGTWDTLTVDVA
ncbi:hypothetical protein [Streptomyces sp. NBC_01304]|uniref:hypothetical protein n=1 Tax=Streptomyces sp. NBC_01304 TaxID=2903818 RepID=UPI002E128FD6|nr:hypothetical protein OG430_24600 [Streptomyces sp. NBC_01304]